MNVYEKKGQSSQNIQNRTIKTNKWIFAGAGAADILKTDYYVMVDVSLLVTTEFQRFYQEWILNIPYGKKKQIFIPAIEFKNTSSVTYDGIQILQYERCNDYASLFCNIKEIGTWLFITENEKKKGEIIRAAKDAGMYIFVYGLDQEGKLKPSKSTMKEQHKSFNKLSATNAFCFQMKSHQ